MDLLNLQGQRLAIEGDQWRELLEIAREFGWQPGGTQAPPIQFDPVDSQAQFQTWKGGYLQPCGQVVTRRDAASLANAIEAASLPPNPFQSNSLLNLSEAVDFFRTGPFLVAEDPAGDRSAPDPWWESQRTRAANGTIAAEEAPVRRGR
jgi:hypothetical protein